MKTNEFSLRFDIVTLRLSIKKIISKSRASLNTHRKCNGMEQTGQLSNGKLSFTFTDF